MSLVSMGANFLCHLVNVLVGKLSLSCHTSCHSCHLVGHRVPTRPRILASLGLNILLFAASTIFTRLSTDSWQLGFYSLTLTFALLFNINDSVFQGAYTSIMARFPSRFMGSMMQGQGLGGILSSGLSVVLILIGSGDTVEVATWYFLFATVFLLVSLALYFMVNYNVFFNHFLTDEKEIHQDKAKDKSSLGHLKVVKTIWMQMISIFLVTVLNMSVYPALVRLAEPVNESETWGKYFLPVGVFFAFNFLDFVGRILAGLVKWPNPTKPESNLSVLIITVLRFIFVPILLLCNLSPDDRQVTQVLIESDAVFLSFHALLSLSSGYLMTISMMNAPLMVEDEDKSVVGSLMVFMLVFGLLSGAALSFLWISIL